VTTTSLVDCFSVIRDPRQENKIDHELIILFTYLTNQTKFTDVHNGFRIMTRHFCEHFEFQQNRMAHASEILSYIARLKVNFIEYPVTITYTEYSLDKGQRMTHGLRVLMELFIGKLF